MKRYKRAMAELPVPPELIASTAIAMHKQLECQEQRRRPALVVVRGVIAAVMLLMFIPIAMLWQNNRLIRTPLIADDVVFDVDLKNGTLHFEQDDSNILLFPDAQFGIAAVEKERWTPERYAEYLGKELHLQGIPEKLPLVDQWAEVFILDGEKVVSDHGFLLYRSVDGLSQIEINVSKGRLPPGSLPNVADNSLMEEVPMHLSWISKENGKLWQAQFLQNDIGYQIRSIGITQETFIQLLHSIVK